MIRTSVIAAAIGLASGAAASPAQAQLVEEVRFGILQHNICVLDCDNANKEDGPDIEGELVFASPDILDIVWSPRPYLVGNYNTAGDTSFAGIGLLWNWDFAPGWSFEPGIGYVIHDGELEAPFPQGDPRNLPFNATTVYLGSRDLFRTSFALNRDFGDDWGVQLQYEHLSHGQIIGEGRNQGLDSIGLRVYRRF